MATAVYDTGEAMSESHIPGKMIIIMQNCSVKKRASICYSRHDKLRKEKCNIFSYVLCSQNTLNH
jgi:hypothetical protein